MKHLWKTTAVIAGMVFGHAGRSHSQLSGELLAHDPSTVLFDNGRYWYFSTGDMLGVRSSSDLVNWTGEPTAFNAVPSWVPAQVPGYSGSSLWAPDVIELGGTYYLYYSASIFGTKLSGIGYASSPTLDPDAPGYGWTDHGLVIGSNHGSPYNAIDPSMMLDETTGKLWMTWGSFNNGIYVKEMNPLTGAPLSGSPGVNVAAPGPTPEIEGAAMMQHDGYYYMFVNWGGCCSGENSTYNMRVGRSLSPTGPFLDRDGVNLLSGGGTLFLDDDGRKIGPGHFSLTDVNGQQKFSYHYYDGGRDGFPTFAIRDLHWTADGWPSVWEVNPNWIGVSGSTWNTASNWTNSEIPDGVGHAVNFASQNGGPFSVALPTGGATVGTVNFRGFSSYTIGNTAGPTLTIDDTNGESATINVAEGSHTINAPISAQDTLEVNVTPDASNLTLGGQVNGSELRKFGDGNLELAGTNVYSGTAFVHHGTLTITGGTTIGGFISVGQILGDDGTLSVEGSGSLTAYFDLNIGDTGASDLDATGTLFIKDQASITLNTGGGFYVGSGFFNNTQAQGIVHQSGGTLTVNRPNDASFVLGGRTSDDAEGTYNLTGGTVNANTNVQVGRFGQGTVNQSGGTFNANQDVSIAQRTGSIGHWTLDAGTLNQTNAARIFFIGQGGDGTLTVSGTGEANIAGQVILGQTSVADGTLNLDGGVFTAQLISRGTGSGVVNLNGGVLRAGTDQTPLLQALTAVNVQAGGAVIDTQNFGVNLDQPLNHDPALGATPDGGLTKRGAGTLRLTGNNGYTGDTVIEAGTLVLLNSGSINESPILDVRPGATLNVAGANGFNGGTVVSGQALINDGTVDGDMAGLTGASVAGAGHFANHLTMQAGSTLKVGRLSDPPDFITTGPAPLGGFSAETMSVAGTVQLDSGATLSLDIANSEINDRLVVGGTLNAGGFLNVRLDSSGTLGLGDSFDLLDFNAVAGTFDSVILPALNADLNWDTSGLLLDGVIRIVGDTLFGDYNGSGQVEQADLDLVLQNWGVNTDANTGGAVPTGWTHDLPQGLVDQDELDGVLLNWGDTAAPDFRSVNVPEPTTLIALAPALGCCSRRRRSNIKRARPG